MGAWRSFALVFLALSISSCHRSQGALSATGYVPHYNGYEVRFADPASRALMSADWQLDNFARDGDGFLPKTGSDYVVELFLDANDDGASDSLGEEPIYDLRFTHKQAAGVIWMRSIPLERPEEHRKLRVLADALVESISGGGNALVQLGGRAYRTNKEYRYAGKVLQRAEGALAGKPAHVITVDVSNVDRLKVEPGSVETRITLVLVRTGVKRAYSRSSRRQFPLLLLVGYASSPDDFAAAEPEFISLLSRIQIDGQAGFRVHEPVAARPNAQAETREQEPAPPAPAEEEQPTESAEPSQTEDGGSAAP